MDIFVEKSKADFTEHQKVVAEPMMDVFRSIFNENRHFTSLMLLNMLLQSAQMGQKKIIKKLIYFVHFIDPYNPRDWVIAIFLTSFER